MRCRLNCAGHIMTMPWAWFIGLGATPILTSVYMSTEKQSPSHPGIEAAGPIGSWRHSLNRIVSE